MHFSMRKSCKFNLFVCFALTLFFIISIIVVVRIDKQYTLRAQSYATTRATKIINASVESVIDDNPQYESFVHLFQDAENKVTAAEGDTILMNKFKSALTLEIEKKLNENSEQEIFIPIGCIFGTALFNNRGINIPVKLAPVSDIKTDFCDSFENSGINNTKHSLYINIETDLAIISSFSQCTQNVKTSVPVSETLIAGDVPVYFSDSGYIGISHNADISK